MKTDQELAVEEAALALVKTISGWVNLSDDYVELTVDRVAWKTYAARIGNTNALNIATFRDY